MSHHEDCDGFRMHSPRIVDDGQGMWHAECQLDCGFRYPTVGMAGKAVPFAAAQHGGNQECAGECHAWEVSA